MSEIETMLRRAAAELPAAAPDVGARAEAEGLVDVAYASVDSPLGPLVVAATPRGLVRVAYTEHSSADEVLENLSARVSPRVLEAPRRLDPVRRELDEYFAGRREDFGVALDWALTAPGFRRRVLQECARIPFGATRTYKQMAIAAGSPRAFRAAGGALGSNPIPIVVPCHRVLHSGGGLGGYTGGLERKRFLLQLEGVLPTPEGSAGNERMPPRTLRR
jgi:methylated-DNA-[protein]-cysteine S-methyltransferase